MVVVASAYGTMPTTAGVQAPSKKWMMPTLAVLGVTLLAGTAVVYMSSSSPVELTQHSLANNYRSSSDARSELNSYFDSQSAPVMRHGLSSAQAISQLSSIFPAGGDTKMKALRARQQKSVTQDLHYSSAAAQDDLDSYFDNMGGAPKKAHHSHHARRESSSSARDDMDSYWDNLNGQEPHHRWHHKAGTRKPSPEQVAEAKKLALEDYKKQHPNFAKRIDQVHIDWMKTHDDIPTTPTERKQYQNLVKEGKEGAGSAADENPRKLALQKYLDEHPDVKAKMVKAKKEFVENYGHPPKLTSKAEMKAYHDMMKRAVGHVDISMDKELGAKADAKKPQDKVAQLKKFEKENPIVKDKIHKVHKMWSSKHAGPPKTPAEEEEYGQLMKKFVVPAVATLQAAMDDSTAKPAAAKPTK